MRHLWKLLIDCWTMLQRDFNVKHIFFARQSMIQIIKGVWQVPLREKITITLSVNSVWINHNLVVFSLKKKKREDATLASAKIGNCIWRFPFTSAKLWLHPIKNELMHKVLWLYPSFLLFYIWTPKFFCPVLLIYYIMHCHCVLFTLIRNSIDSFCFLHRKRNIITVYDPCYARLE